MIKIAIISSINPNNKTGLFNAVHERIIHMKIIKEVIVDPFIFIPYNSYFKSKITHSHYESIRPFEHIYEGITYKLIWLPCTLFDKFISKSFNQYQPILRRFLFYNYQKLFLSYDIISSHTILTSLFAFDLYNKYKIPFSCTWHGSDINEFPYRGVKMKNNVKTLLNNAFVNFFVSNALKNNAYIITDSIKNAKVSYNGVDESFNNYKKNLKKGKDCNDKKIAYVGNLVKIKNVLSLPDIFEFLKKRDVFQYEFWIIGQGELQRQLEDSFKKKQIDVIFKGSKTKDELVLIYNQIDCLVLPSINEGLGMVALEALKCGTPVVGSNRGGIPEAIGSENCVELDSNFSKNMAIKIEKILLSNKVFNLREMFNWDVIVRSEFQEFKTIINS